MSAATIASDASLAISGLILAAAAVLAVLWLRIRTRCRCGHSRQTHEHYRQGSDCAVCGCPRWRRHRYSAAELADLSRTDIPGWPYARQVPQSGEVAWEAVMRAVDGDPPPEWDPLIVRDPGNPQRGDDGR